MHGVGYHSTEGAKLEARVHELALTLSILTLCQGQPRRSIGHLEGEGTLLRRIDQALCTSSALGLVGEDKIRGWDSPCRCHIQLEVIGHKVEHGLPLIALEGDVAGQIDRSPTDGETLLAIALPGHQGVDVGSMTVGLTLTDRTKDHKTLVLGLLLVKLEGDFLGSIVRKAKGLAINVCVRAEDAESGGGCIDIQLDRLSCVGR